MSVTKIPILLTLFACQSSIITTQEGTTENWDELDDAEVEETEESESLSEDENEDLDLEEDEQDELDDASDSCTYTSFNILQKYHFFDANVVRTRSAGQK